MFAARRRHPSYGRVSVRESLRVFARVTESLRAESEAPRPPMAAEGAAPSRTAARAVGGCTSFEDMCAATDVCGAGRMNSHVSCGNTMQCFASLFLPPSGWRMAHLLDGGTLWQLGHNANIVIYSWRIHVSTRARLWLGLPEFSRAARGDFSRWAQSVGRWSSGRSLDRLERQLLQVRPHGA
jgi:hypothetical protein